MSITVPPISDNARVVVAEAVGTAVLVIGGIGTAVLATADGLSVGTLGVSLAFGLSLLVMAYAIGPVSGCHINPAVTVGLWSIGKTRTADLPLYFAGQGLGLLAGSTTVFAMANRSGFEAADNFAANGWAQLSPGGYGFGSMVAVEVALTALLVFVVASSAHKRFVPAASGLMIGLTLALIHLISIPVDNTSVNPARSAASAIWARGDALEQLWAFIVFPVIGAVLGALLWQLVDDRDDQPQKEA